MSGDDDKVPPFPTDDDSGQGPLVNKGRWPALIAVVGAAVLGAWAYTSTAMIGSLAAMAKQRWASASQQIADWRDGPGERQVQVHLKVIEGANPAEKPYGTIRMTSAALMQAQFPRNAERFVPIAGKDDCLVAADAYIPHPLPGTAITAAYLIGFPRNLPGLAGAREVGESTPKQGKVQVVNLARRSDGTGGATPDGIYKFHVAAERAGAEPIRTAERAGAEPIRTAEATVEVSEQGAKVTLNGRELDCDVTGKSPIVPVKPVEELSLS